jgi:molybdopterin-guanine dinucleotide biosynthesis protein A
VAKIGEREQEDMMIHTFIQAGGESARMGRNKALLPLGGKRCMEWVIAAARAVASEITVITSDPRVKAFCRRAGVGSASDLSSGVGPLAGLEAALVRCSGKAALILACDLPFLTGDLLHRLVSSFREAEALVPLDAEGRPQPLCAIYSVACLPAVREAITRGERRMTQLLERLAVRFLPFSEISHLPGAEEFFWDLDTPDDYARARQRLRERRTGHSQDAC